MNVAQYADLEPELTDNGFLSLPIRGNDGTGKSPKSPGAGNWRDYQDRWPTDQERHSDRWATKPGAWVMCGTQSRNLAAFDLEDKIGNYAETFHQALEDNGVKGLWRDLYDLCRSRTPSGGLHVYVTVQLEGHDMPAGEVLARTTTGEVVAETRAEGQGIVAPGTDGSAHPAGKPWEWEAGNWSTVPTISISQYNAICDVLRSISDEPEPPPPATTTPPTATTGQTGTSPLDDYDQRYKGQQVLIKAGFTYTETDRNGNDHFTRPGKDPKHGTSATVYADEGTTTLFSTSINAPAEYTNGRRKLRPSQLYTALFHQGDYNAAATALAADGHGTIDQTWATSAAELDQAAESIADDTTTTLDPDPDVFDLLDRPDPEYDWLVPGLLERHDRVILTGVEGHGKSTLLRQLGVQMGAGVQPFDFGEAFDPLTVLLVDLENPETILRRELRGIVEAANGQLDRHRFIPIPRPEGIDLHNEADIVWLAQRIEANQADVLMIGPLYKMADGDPTTEEHAKAIATALDWIRARYKVAVLIEAHSPHATGGGKRPTRPYGASLWMRWPEIGLHLTEGGQLVHWRGQRSEREWPAALIRDGQWPWSPAATKDAKWATVVDFLSNVDAPMSQREVSIGTSIPLGTLNRMIQANKRQWNELQERLKGDFDESF